MSETSGRGLYYEPMVSFEAVDPVSIERAMVVDEICEYYDELTHNTLHALVGQSRGEAWEKGPDGLFAKVVEPQTAVLAEEKNVLPSVPMFVETATGAIALSGGANVIDLSAARALRKTKKHPSVAEEVPLSEERVGLFQA